ncbi:MAG: hypothetical protein Q9M36_02740 [Sulfurovum sp.]|nr:hypothetical protein [Sulfurovum sp.]
MSNLENKAKMKDVRKAWGGVFKALFGKQEDNMMLKDLRIKKGILNGLGYALWIGFVLPANVLKFLLTPSWSWIRFIERHVISPVFELDLISGGESPSSILGEIYEKNLNYYKTTADSGVSSQTLKPSISVLERIRIFAKIRVILTLVLFVIGAFAMWEFFDEVIDTIGLLFGFLATFFGFVSMDNGFDTDAIIGGLTAGAILANATWIIGGALIAYMLIFAIRFVSEGVRSLASGTDEAMLKNFVEDTMHFTVSKSIELYGEKIALQAYDLVLENVVLKDNNLRKKPFYKMIEESHEPWKDNMDEEQNAIDLAEEAENEQRY